MKIVYIFLLTLFISACSNTQGSSTYAGTKEKNHDLACLNATSQSQTVDFAAKEKSFYLIVTRTLDTPHSLGFIMAKQDNSFFLNVELFCGVEKSERKLYSTTTLTEEQKSTIYTLYDDIEVSKLRNLKNESNFTDGSFWGLTVIESDKVLESFRVSNPGAGRETEESKNLFKLGEYIWDIAKIDSLLY